MAGVGFGIEYAWAAIDCVLMPSSVLFGDPFVIPCTYACQLWRPCFCQDDSDEEFFNPMMREGAVPPLLNNENKTHLKRQKVTPTGLAINRQ